MENNKIVVKENGKNVTYRVVLSVEDVEGKNFVVYTNDEKKGNDIICYAALYENVDGNVKLTSIKEDKDWEFVRDLINSIQHTEE